MKNGGNHIQDKTDHPILNDPDNPYGVDFTIVGNAMPNSSEPGIVMVVRDDNGNGLRDDIWYELKGSNHDLPSTVKNYTVTYKKSKIGSGSRRRLDGQQWKQRILEKSVGAHTALLSFAGNLFGWRAKDRKKGGEER